MKKILYFIMIFAAMIAAFALTACGKKNNDSETNEAVDIPFVENFTCDYYTGAGFATRVVRGNSFGCEDEVLIKLSFTLSAKAFKDGKRRLTIKPILSEGFYGSIVSANTSSVNDKELTAAYDVDDKKSKKCEIEFKTKFNYSNGELQVGYAYDEDEYRTTGLYLLSCGQSFKFTYDAWTDGYRISQDPINRDWLLNADQIKIPDEFAGKPVTVIADSLFKSCNLSEVEIPDSIMHIENATFFDCKNLRYNEYSNALYLGNEQNPYVALIKSDRDNITEAHVNSATKVIYDDAFRNCSRLMSIEIPNGVTSIGKRVFFCCWELESVAMPNSVAYIGDEAFGNCSRLYSIKIPNVTSIGENVFVGCSELRCNEYRGADYLGNEQNPYVILIKGSSTGEINKATKFIHSGAFQYCWSLTSITIPDSVTSIGCGAFSDCDGLTSITIPDSVTSIGGGAFSDCSSLTTITIPESVTSIGGGVFGFCSSLQSINYGGSIDDWLNLASSSGVLHPYGEIIVKCSDGKIKFRLMI